MAGARSPKGVKAAALRTGRLNVMPRLEYRVLLLTALALLAAGCSQASITELGNRTFRIQGPGIPGGSTQPNRRLAARACPGGYRVLHSTVRDNTPDGYSKEPGTFTDWTIRCL